MNEPINTGRRTQSRALITLATLATLVAVFYLEEDWRGRRAWEQCKAQLETGGIVMDWNQYLPPPVPDDQNFFTASTNILLRFKKAETEAERKALAQCVWLSIVYGTNSFPVFESAKNKPLAVAQIHLLPTATASSAARANDLVLQLHEPGSPEKVRNLLQKAIGQSLTGAAGFKFSELQLSKLTPAQIFLSAEPPPSLAELENLIPKDLVTNIGQLRIEASGEKSTFEVRLTGVRITAAADYLSWSEQYAPALEEVRAALARPYAVIPGDYSRPFLRPIPNFVALRSIAQTLAQRAQCDILLGQPDPALRELTLLHDLCRMLTHPPAGKPVTLVESMIHVAITGLYVAAVADGFRRQVWQDAQLTTLQTQLQAIHLPPLVEESFRDELVGSAHTLDTATPTELHKLLSLHSRNTPANLWERLTNPDFWLLQVAPRGWYYQNMAVAAKLEQKPLAGFDLPNDLIRPEAARIGNAEVETTLRHWSPWHLWAAIAVPNAFKAMQTTAYNQNLVNEAQIVCALERYHLAHGEYPASLEALRPQYCDALPHDLIGGQPLHYQRTEAGQFLLYSVGWNEKDDGGAVALTPSGAEDREHGDWVWSH